MCEIKDFTGNFDSTLILQRKLLNDIASKFQIFGLFYYFGGLFSYMYAHMPHSSWTCACQSISLIREGYGTLSSSYIECLQHLLYFHFIINCITRDQVSLNILWSQRSRKTKPSLIVLCIRRMYLVYTCTGMIILIHFAGNQELCNKILWLYSIQQRTSFGKYLIGWRYNRDRLQASARPQLIMQSCDDSEVVEMRLL